MANRHTPSDRLTELAKVRRKARRGFKEINRKKNALRSYGELEHKLNMTIILSVAGYTNGQIAASLGETRKTVGEWKKDPKWNEEYNRVVNSLTDSAKILLQSYQIEAVHTLIVLMRTSEEDGVILKAVGEILDRGGIPKTSRKENEINNNDNLIVTDDGLVEKLRVASPEVQEEAAQLIEGLENLLKRGVTEGNLNGDSETPNPDNS